MSIFEVIGMGILEWASIVFIVFCGIVIYISIDYNSLLYELGIIRKIISIIGIIAGGLVAFSGLTVGIFFFTAFSVHLKWEFIFIVFVPLWSGIIIAMNLPIIGGAEK